MLDQKVEITYGDRISRIYIASDLETAAISSALIEVRIVSCK
jgi:hypothetical protein